MKKVPLSPGEKLALRNKTHILTSKAVDEIKKAFPDDVKSVLIRANVGAHIIDFPFPHESGGMSVMDIEFNEQGGLSIPLHHHEPGDYGVPAVLSIDGLNTVIQQITEQLAKG